MITWVVVRELVLREGAIVGLLGLGNLMMLDILCVITCCAHAI